MRCDDDDPSSRWQRIVARWLATLTDETKTKAADYLTDLFAILKAGWFEFAYRTAIYWHVGEVKDAKNPLHATLSDALKLTDEGAYFPKSFAKLQSILRTLKEEQFVSFIQ